MKAKDMFSQFLKEKSLPPAAFDAFAFGSDADFLAGLVLQGKKTAASSAFDLYVHENIPLPEAGQYSVVLDSREEAVCVIRTTFVYVCAFDKVAPLHAAKEGEGSLREWRKAHEAFFACELENAGLEFHKKIPVVCEEFEVVYPKKEERE